MNKVPTLEYGGGKSFSFLREGVTISLDAGAVGVLCNGDQLILHKKMAEKPLTCGEVTRGGGSLTLPIVAYDMFQSFAS
jgi:hypothetical protein